VLVPLLRANAIFFWTGYGDWQTAAKDCLGERRRSHAFRATLVDGVLRLPNGTMESAQILLGHKRLATTAIYGL